MFAWDASSNNRAMIAGKISLALNAISITRTAEKENTGDSAKIQLAKARGARCGPSGSSTS